MPIYVLAGEEEFEIERRAEQLKKDLLDPAWATFNLVNHCGGDLKDVLESAAMVPFGPGNKVILFSNCDLFTKKRGKADDSESAKSGKDKSAKTFDDLDHALKTVAPNTVLIFSCIANFDNSLKTSKVFAKYAEIEKFEKKKYYAGAANREIVSWSQKEAHRFGCTIEEPAVFYLAESTEVNLRQMASEIEKAAVFILPEKTVKLKHVAQLSPHFSHIFALLDHWATGKKTKVLESVQELQTRNEPVHKVIATLQTTLSKWINYRLEIDRSIRSVSGGRDVGRHEVNVKSVAQKFVFGGQNTFVIEQDINRVKNLGLDYLVAKKKQLTEIEDGIKTGQIPESHALALFFTR